MKDESREIKRFESDDEQKNKRYENNNELENSKKSNYNKNFSRRVNENIKRRRMSMVGFAISITLMIIAISMSINQHKKDEIAKEQFEMNNMAKIASSEISKNVNEVKEKRAKDKSRNNIKDDSLNALNENSINDKEIKDVNGNTEKTNGSNLDENVRNNANSENNSNANNERNGDAKLVSSNLNNTNQANSNNQNEANKINQSNRQNEQNINKNNEQKNTNNSNKTNSENNFIMPADGEVIKKYSMDSLVYSNTLEEWVTHRGIDIKGELYDDVKASKSGKIKSIKNDPRYGTSIIIEHENGFKTIYSCLIETTEGLEEGKEVKQGDVIGKMGNSGVFETADGSHLHFEMLKNNEYVNPEIYVK